MPLTVVRPDLPPDPRKDLVRYLMDQWRRARDGRSTQVDHDQQRWDKNYRGIPDAKERNFPWPKSSNLVVPLIRMHLDTMVARTLGITFGTHPLVKTVGFPQEVADSYEKYANYKCQYQWQIYQTAWEFMFSGNKNGTAVCKIPWVDLKTYDVSPGQASGSSMHEQEVDLYVGPRPEIIAFDDFYVYPITATRAHHIQIRFHRLRYTGEQVREFCDTGKWLRAWESAKDKPGMKSYLKRPADVQRTAEQMAAGVADPDFDELAPIECHFRYALSGRYYDLVALLLEDANDILDLYYNPYPLNISTFVDYIPFPRETVYYGEALCQILEQLQEEVSTIHNDRRNNSVLANSPQIKLVDTAMLPNASATSWYPGKIWRVASKDDFSTEVIGRALDPMLDQEGWDFQLADKLMGTNPIQMGQAEGSQGKRGVYNTGGTMAILAESNDRQGESIRRYRNALGQVCKVAMILQAQFQGLEDPCLAYFPPDDQEKIQQALQYATTTKTHMTPFEIRTSTASMNKEVDRQNLMQMAGVMNNYYGQLQQLAVQYLNPAIANSVLHELIGEILVGQQYLAKRLLTAFDEIDPQGIMPDVKALVESSQQQPQQQPGQPPAGPQGMPVQPGGGETPGAGISRAGLAGVLALPSPATGAGGSVPQGSPS